MTKFYVFKEVTNLQMENAIWGCFFLIALNKKSSQTSK